MDGNGRTGRLIMNLELLKGGYPITIIEKDDRPIYYELRKRRKRVTEIVYRTFYRKNPSIKPLPLLMNESPVIYHKIRARITNMYKLTDKEILSAIFTIRYTVY